MDKDDDFASSTSTNIPLPHPNTATTTTTDAYAATTTTTTTKQEEQDIIQLPVLQYGFCQQPLGWKELTQIITDGEFSKLTRSQADQRDYEIFKRNLLRQWKSIYDYLLVDKFGMAKECNQEDGLWYAAAAAPAAATTTTTTTTTTQPRSARVVLVRNDFPYCMEASIEHWILWKLNDGSCTPDDIENAKMELRQQKTDGVELEFLHWINPPHLQSLPDIDHVHILVWSKPTFSSSMMNND